MEEKSNLSFITIIYNLSQTFFRLVSDITQLARAEAHLAVSSLVHLVLLYLLAGLLLLTTWICLLGAVIASLVAIHLSWLTSFLFVTLLNILLLITLFLYIKKMKKNLTFQATRKQLLNLTKSTAMTKGT
ncbi:MAG: phage holin family protein [Gammaproteobacteria bacterium]|nr:phage holin family protein [Gammaproteobacteria bacterium]